MLLDGSEATDEKIRAMLHFDVNNGIARRAWARNPHANEAIRTEMDRSPDLRVTLPHFVDSQLIDSLF
jgi:urocanate hydratase